MGRVKQAMSFSLSSITQRPTTVVCGMYMYKSTFTSLDGVHLIANTVELRFSKRRCGKEPRFTRSSTFHFIKKNFKKISLL